MSRFSEAAIGLRATHVGGSWSERTSLPGGSWPRAVRALRQSGVVIYSETLRRAET